MRNFTAVEGKKGTQLNDILLPTSELSGERNHFRWTSLLSNIHEGGPFVLKRTNKLAPLY